MNPRDRYDEICDDLAARDPDIELSQMMGMPCVKRGGKMVIGYARSGEMVFKLPESPSTRRPSAWTARTSSTPPAGDNPSRSGSRCPTPTKANGRSSRTPRSDSALTEPAAGFLVAVDDRALAAVEDDVEVPAVHRLLGPPAVDAHATPPERAPPACD